jgi:hypothetical protein
MHDDMKSLGPPTYVDPISGRKYPISEPRWRSDTGASLMITALLGIGRNMIDTRKRSLWRYAAALPVDVPDPITMGEGCTPLISHKWGGVPALFKLEWLSPTGSFKDRGASVMLSILRQQGVTEVLEDSSGNGGAAIAAYAAAGGLAAKILVPASTAQDKIVQMRAYGAEIELIPGTRQDTSDAAERQAATIFYAGHNWQPFFLQGTKTLAYELWEDLKFKAPDNVIIPTGAGSNVMGCDIGFGAARSQACPGCSQRSRRIARRFTRASWPAPMISRQSRSARRSRRERRSQSPCGPAKSWRLCSALAVRPSPSWKLRSKGPCSNSAESASMRSPPPPSQAPRSQSCWNAASFNPQRRLCWC